MQKKIITNIILIFTAIILNILTAYTQSENVTLLSGMFYKTISREPVQTTAYFIDEDGNSLKLSSEINGQFQGIIKSGHTYMIAFDGYLLNDNNAQLILPPAKEYKELKQNYELIPITGKSEILSVDAFAPNSDIVNKDALHQLLKLKYFLKANPNAKINIYISAEDTFMKSTKKKSKSGLSPLDDLLERRANHIKDILTSLKIKEFTYNIQKISATASSQTKQRKGNKKDKNTNCFKLITLKVDIDKIIKL